MTYRLTSAGRFTLVALFFAWGVMGVMVRMTMPHFKESFELGFRDAFLIQSAFFLTYLLFARMSGRITARIGLGNGVTLGLALMACGSLGLAASTLLSSYVALLPSVFVLASGITFLQVSANPLATVEGPMRSASSNLTFSQAFNSLGTVVAPLIAALAFLGTTEQPLEPVRWLFLVFAACLAALALAARTLLTHGQDEPIEKRLIEENPTSPIPRFRLHASVGAIFLYVGAEVCISTTLLNLLELDGFLNVSRTVGAMLVSIFWIGMVIGRFFGVPLLDKFDRRWVLASSAIGAALTCLGATASTGQNAAILILASGLFCGIQFPTIFAIGSSDLEPSDRARAAGWLCTGIVGGGIIPLVYGSLADVTSLRFALVVPAFCFVAIAGYAIRFGGSPLIGKPAIRSA